MGSLTTASVSSVSPLILKLVSALAVLFIGYLAAKGAGYVVTFLLKLIKLDLASKKIGLAAFIEKGDVKRTASELVGDLAYWIIIFMSVFFVAKILAVPIKPIVLALLAFVGTVFIVAVVIGAGLFLASLLSAIVKMLAVNFGIEGARTFSRFIYYIVIIFAFLLALAHLGIKTELIGAKLDVIIGAIGLAAAIAFGLGCKDMAADFLHNLFKAK